MCVYGGTLFAFWNSVEKAVNTDFFIACCKALTVPSFYKRAEGGPTRVEKHICVDTAFHFIFFFDK